MELDQIMSKDDFLKLFITQIQNQDPLDPMDNTEFTSQLAQFSSLEQLQNVNTTLEALVEYENSIQNTLAVNFIGKEVTAVGNGITVTEDQSQYKLRYSLDKDATDVNVIIKYEDGSTVAILEEGAQTSGENFCNWDGLDQYGNPVSPGNYTFTVSATNLEGETVTASTYSSGVVTGVSFEDGVTYLEVNGSPVSLSNIVSFNSID